MPPIKRRARHLTVTATYFFTQADLRKALAWGRRSRYTYERDGEIAELLLAAQDEGIIAGTVDEVWSPEVSAGRD